MTLREDQRTNGQNYFLLPDYMDSERCRARFHDLSGIIVKFGKNGSSYGLTQDGLFCHDCCPSCQAIYHKHDTNDNSYWSHVNKMMNEHLKECHQVLKQSTHTGNGTYIGPFAFTLTKSPNDDLSQEDMIKAVKKLMKQKSCPVEKYAWYLEYGDPETKSHPHIHGLYETVTGGRIETKHFKRAWPIWDPSVTLGAGFRGGYHRPVKSEECYNDYIKDYGRNIIGENFGL